MAAGLGLAAGSMTYGASGNAFNSIAAGTATYKGTKEFMQNSAKTLTNDTAQLFQAAGNKTAADAAIHASNIRANADVYEDGSKLKEEIDKAFDQIKSELDKLTDDGKANFKSTIKNVMERDIRENPGLTNDQLFQRAMQNSAVQSCLSKTRPDNDKGPVDTNAMKGGIAAVSNLQRNKVIYDNMKSAGDIGLSTDTMISESIKTFESYVAADATYTKEDTTAATNVINGSTAVEEKIEEMSIEQIEANEKALEKQMDKELAKMGMYSNDEMIGGIEEVRKVYEQEIKKHEDEYKRLQAEADRFASERIEREKQEILTRFRELETASANALTTQAQAEVRRREQELMNDYQSLVKEVNSIASRYSEGDAFRENLTSYATGFDDLDKAYNKKRRNINRNS